MGRFSSLPFLFLSMLILCSAISRSQGIFKISTDEKISRSSLVIEGKVISKRSYWGEGHRMIYTANAIEIYKIFKGSWQKDTIEIITVGGAVDGHYIHASHLLSLDKNDLGIFFCTNTKDNKFDVYSSTQGFFKYDLQSKRATAPFVEYEDIERTLYPELSNKIKQKVQVKNATFSVEKVSREINLRSNSVLAPVISSFNPITVNAGAFMDPANNLLTISGTGFGTKTGSAAISFQSADANPGTFITLDNTSPLIVSWSDVQIRVRVPGNAGTGFFRVFDASGAMVTSSSPINVLFSVLTADLGDPYGIKQFNLGNRNGTGGYSIKYSTNTSNSGVNINTSPAKGTFQRALNTWKSNTGVNFVEGGTSTLQTVEPDDGENIIMFDNGGTGSTPLAAGVLATCYSGLTICTNDPVNNQTVKTGFDIVIRNSGFSSGSTPFTFGPCPPYSSTSSAVDLETVLLHELGHALNLGHVVDNFEGSGAGNVNPPKVMNFSLTINQRRISLDYSSLLGAAYQTVPDTYLYGNCITATQMVPLAINVEPNDNCPVTFPETETPNFATVNFNLALATSNKFEDPGFNQMEEDPSGTNITNTAFYALRTNASGGNLSVKVSNYTTSPTDIAACTIGQGVDVTGVKMSLYKLNECPGGGNYPTPLAYNVFRQNGTLPIVNGLLPSSNYLVVLDGLQNTKALFDLEFTGTALGEQEMSEFSLFVANNPVQTSDLHIIVTNKELQIFTFAITNSLGQMVASKQLSVGQGRQDITLPTLSLRNGVYFLTAYGADNKRVKTIKLAIVR